jgi:hypothetical protein
MLAVREGLVMFRYALTSFILCLGTVALSQTGVISGGQGGGGVVHHRVPFSADVTNETDRVLADGNRIHRVMREKIYWDSEGRYRQEIMPPDDQADAGVRHQVMIRDPVARVNIHLDMQSKTADVRHYLTPEQFAQTIPQQPARKAPPFTSTKEELGTQVIEGYVVKGVKITRTLPAGTEGNDQPIVTTIESWQSADLGETLLNKADDPRMGQMTRTLTNIQRGEPDPALFQVPAEFTVREMPH